MRKRADRFARFCVAESCRTPAKVDLIPAQREGLTRAPSRQSEETSGIRRGRPEPLVLRLPEGFPQGHVFDIAQPPIALTVRKTDHSAYRIVRSHPVAHCIGEDRAQETNNSIGCGPASSHPRQAPLFAVLVLPAVLPAAISCK